MERSILPATWQVPAEIRSRLGSSAGRQRAMMSDGHLLLVLHRPPKEDEVEREGRFFWRQPDGTWSSSDHGGGINALGRHLDQYDDILQKLDQREEKANSAPDYFAILNELAPLLRASRHMHQVLQEARKQCPQDRELINVRDKSYELERTAELLYNDAKNALDFLVVQRAEEQAQSSRRLETATHRLNMLAAFFLPLATISAVLEVAPNQVQQHLREPVPLLALVTCGLVAGFVLTRIVGSDTGKAR